MVTSGQIRAARALLGLSQAQLAEMIGTGKKTIQRAETGSGSVSALTITKIQEALETAGIVFVPVNGGGPGVRLAKQ